MYSNSRICIQPPVGPLTSRRRRRLDRRLHDCRSGRRRARRSGPVEHHDRPLLPAFGAIPRARVGAGRGRSRAHCGADVALRRSTRIRCFLLLGRAATSARERRHDRHRHHAKDPVHVPHLSDDTRLSRRVIDRRAPLRTNHSHAHRPSCPPAAPGTHARARTPRTPTRKAKSRSKTLEATPADTSIPRFWPELTVPGEPLRDACRSAPLRGRTPQRRALSLPRPHSARDM